MERIGKISFTISLRGVKKGWKGTGQEWKVSFLKREFRERKVVGSGRKDKRK
jgi:hypothetical protein